MTVQTDRFASFQLLEDALGKKGYSTTVEEMIPMTATYRSSQGASWTTQVAHIAYPMNSSIVRSTSIHKEKAYAFAALHGFPVPYSVVVTSTPSRQRAEALFAKYGSLVVKPTDASLSRGLTLDITDYEQLRDAITEARTIAPTVFIQQQVVGEEIRFIVLDGNVEAALLRRTARVIGDGVSTIADLIKAENKIRRTLPVEMISYPELDGSLVRPELLNSSQVPSDGEVIELNKSTMVRGGASIYNVLSDVDASYVDKVTALVRQLGAGFIVADVFCQDYMLPASAVNYWLIEFNTAPALKLCYACRDGHQYDIAERLATVIDRELTGAKY